MAVAPYKAILPSWRVRYSLIGSTLGASSLKNCIIYGTGLMTAQDVASITATPKRIISVRGPLTRKALIQHGIDCPEHYGDPALLMPVFYKPSPVQEKTISIIPNCGTFSDYCPVVDELVNKYHCKLINMTSYDKWTDIIDDIAGSSFIISESLHGLIVAETYSIPSVWVEFTDHRTEKFNADWSFKFLDFYESISKYGMESIKLYEGYSFDDLLRKKDGWTPGKIDYDEMLKDFPFKIDVQKKFPLKVSQGELARNTAHV